MAGTPTLVAYAMSFAFFAHTTAQQDSPSVSSLNQQAMSLNQKGEWAKARELAAQAVERKDATRVELAEALYSLTYSHHRLGNRDAANENLKKLDTAIRAISKDHWLLREVDSLKRELAAPAAAPKPTAAAQAPAKPTTDIGAVLFEMRYANASNKHEKAIEFGSEALKHPAAESAAVRAEVAMHLYFAHKKLIHEAEARAAKVDFDKVRAQLPAESTLSHQMLMLRKLLGEKGDTALPEASFQPGPDPLWQRAKPADVGMDAELLKEHERMCLESGADAVLVARHGKIVSEWYSPLYREPVFTMSSVKSITALVAGLLVADGKLHIDDPVCKYVPQWCDGLKAKTTVRHVLSMTAGLKNMKSGGVGMSSGGNHSRHAISQAPAWPPGTRWDYSNEGAQLLSPILEKAAGVPLWQYANEKLFRPMGLTQTEFRRDESGGTNTFADAKTTLRELAKFGVLVLNRGRWDSKQIVSADWIDKTVTPCEQNSRYGFLWWLNENPRVWSMQGYLDTSMWAFPDLDVVVCRVQSAPYLHATARYDSERMFDLIVKACGKRDAPP